MPRGHWTYAYKTWWGASIPATNNGPGSPLNVCNWFTVNTNGWIVGVRYLRENTDSYDHIGTIRLESDNTLLATAQFKHKAAGAAGVDGWQHTYFHPRLRVVAGTLYYVCVFFGSRRFYYTASALVGVQTAVGPITVGQDSSAHWNGAYGNGIESTGTHSAGTHYGVDILFLTDPVP